jgi:hypothetical protein
MILLALAHPNLAALALRANCNAAKLRLARNVVRHYF